MNLSAITLYRYRLALKQSLALSEGSLSAREGLLIHIQNSDGFEGWGDAAPLPGYSRENLDEVIQAARKLLPYFEEGVIPESLPSLAFARDTALGMLEGGISGVRAQTTLPLNALLTRGVEKTEHLASFSAVKFKIGTDPKQDADRVNALCDALAPEVALRLDANQAWSMDELNTFAHAIDAERMAYVEEPLKDPTLLSSVYSQTGLRYARDESLRDMNPATLRYDEGLAALIIKPTILGSLNRIAACCEFATMHGLQSVFSSCFESGVGHWSIARLAQTFAEGVPAGLDTYTRLAEDVITPRITTRDGVMDVQVPFMGPYSIPTKGLTEVGSWQA